MCSKPDVNFYNKGTLYGQKARVFSCRYSVQKQALDIIQNACVLK